MRPPLARFLPLAPGPTARAVPGQHAAPGHRAVPRQHAAPGQRAVPRQRAAPGHRAGPGQHAAPGRRAVPGPRAAPTGLDRPDGPGEPDSPGKPGGSDGRDGSVVRHRRLSPVARVRVRHSVVALLLLLAGATSASATDGGPAPTDLAGALADRERAVEPPSRSLDRDGDRAPDPSGGRDATTGATPDPAATHPGPAPQARGAAPDQSPAPEPEPEPEPTPAAEPSPEDSAAEPDPGGEPAPAAVPPPVGGLTEPQMAHAATIVRTGQELGLPAQAHVVALATALQESTLRVLANPVVPASFDYPHDGVGADHDSVGLFQQRPSTGWGTVAECMDPESSARAFYRALQQVPGWQGLPVTVAAQAVQGSAFPYHYAQHEPLARELVAVLG